MPLLQAELLARLKAALPPTTSDIGVLVLLNDVRSSFSFAASNVNAATGVLTVAGHNFLDGGNGTRVRFPSSAPGALTLNLDYWVRNVSGSTFQLSATPGGSAIGSFSSTGSGAMTLSDQPLVATDQNLEAPTENTLQWVRKEVGGSRISLNTPASTSYVIQTVSGTLRSAVPLSAPIDNSAGGSTLVFSKMLLLVGGNTTTGDTTGEPQRWWDVTGSVAAGASVTYLLNAFDSN